MVFVYAWRHLQEERFFPGVGSRGEKHSVFKFAANKIIPLSLKRDFKELYENGLVLKEGGVVLCCKENTKGLRVAFGLSCKVIQTAVKRNKIKRWSRQILREMETLKGVSLDVLITVNREQDCYENFKKNFKFLMEKALRTIFSKSPSSFYCFL